MESSLLVWQWRNTNIYFQRSGAKTHQYGIAASSIIMMDEAFFIAAFPGQTDKGVNMSGKATIVPAFLLALTMTALAPAGTAYERPDNRPAIVLAAFGASEVEAVQSILNIEKRVAAAFPGYDVHLAFTSNIIRNIWHKRAKDAAFRRENPDIPDAIYDINNVLTTLAKIQEDGARLVLVQSLHITDGEEYQDLANLVSALENYKTMKPVLHPFPWIGVGEPALGLGDGQNRYLERAAEAIAPLYRKVWDKGAALVLMGHGNEHLDQEVFAKFQKVLREKYSPYIYIGAVEAKPFPEDIVEEMKKTEGAPKSVLVAPLMIVAGDHARNDMAGDEEDSWINIFKASGYEAEPYLVGLGSNPSWADIYVEHLKALEPKIVAKKANDDKAQD